MAYISASGCCWKISMNSEPNPSPTIATRTLPMVAPLYFGYLIRSRICNRCNAVESSRKTYSTPPIADMYERRRRLVLVGNFGVGLHMHIRCSIFVVLLFAAATFAKESTDRPHAGSNQRPFTPEEAQKKFVVPPGFEVRLFAAEPDVANPVAMTFDEKGRLWVVELYEYPNGAKPGTKGRDRVKVYWDTDG